MTDPIPDALTFANTVDLEQDRPEWHTRERILEAQIHILRILAVLARGPALAAPSAELLDVKKASAYSGLTPWTIRTLIWGGALPTVDLGMRRIWIRRTDLDACLAKRQQTEPAPAPPRARRARR